MRAFASALRKDLRLLWRDKFGLALWLTIPVIILGAMSLIFGGGGSNVKPRGELLVADLDDTLVSGLISSAFSRPPLGELFTVRNMPEPEGRARMARGDGSVLIIIPKGFQDRVLLNEPVTLTLLTNPSQRILPAIAEQSLVMLSEAVHYFHLVAGDQIRAFARRDRPTEAQLIADTIAVNRLVTELATYIDPLLLDIRKDAPAPAPQPAAALNPVKFLFPGMLFMTMLFFARGSSDGLWDELLFGTLRRWQATGSSLAVFLAARLLAFSIVAALVAVLALLAGRRLLGVEIDNWPAAILWVVAGAALWQTAMVILQMAAGNQRRGEILTSFVIFPSMMLGGSMFPFSMMPSSLASIGKATPLGWMVARFDLVLSGKAAAQDLSAWLAVLAVASTLLFIASARLLRRKNFNR